jgi:hypothetical protein
MNARPRRTRNHVPIPSRLDVLLEVIGWTVVVVSFCLYIIVFGLESVDLTFNDSGVDIVFGHSNVSDCLVLLYTLRFRLDLLGFIERISNTFN